MSMASNSSFTRAHIVSTSPRAATSKAYAWAWWPISRISRQTPSAASTPLGLDPTATSAPAAASVNAAARPIPREPPVTNAFFPSKLKLGKTTSLEKFAATAIGILLSVGNHHHLRRFYDRWLGQERDVQSHQCEERRGFQVIGRELAHVGEPPAPQLPGIGQRGQPLEVSPPQRGAAPPPVEPVQARPEHPGPARPTSRRTSGSRGTGFPTRTSGDRTACATGPRPCGGSPRESWPRRRGRSAR